MQLSNSFLQIFFLSNLCLIVTLGLLFFLPPLSAPFCLSAESLCCQPPDLLSDTECTKPKEMCDAILRCLQQRNPPSDSVKDGFFKEENLEFIAIANNTKICHMKKANLADKLWSFLFRLPAVIRPQCFQVTPYVAPPTSHQTNPE